MTRTIKAQDVKPGMDIGWGERGYRYAIGVARVDVALHGNGMCPSPMVEIYNEHDYSTVFHPEFEVEVTVLKEPQPDEPTAFGACVEVAGVKYVRADSRSYAVETYRPWMNEEYIGYCRWDQITNLGHVTVINPDPFTNTEPRGPRVWDWWADVPEMTPVRVSGTETLYRKVGDRIECRRGSWVPAFADEHELNKYSPFTEVLPGA